MQASPANVGCGMGGDLKRVSIGLALCLLLVFSLGNWSIQNTENDLYFFVNSSRIQAFELPSWVPTHWKIQLQKVLQTLPVQSIYDDSLLHKVKADLMLLPFVKEVEVSRSFPRSLQVSLMFHRPLARVVLGTHSYLVDRTGRLLHGEVSLPIKTITTTLAERVYDPPQAGQIWDDPLIQEGVGAAVEAQELEGAFPGLQISLIDLSNFHGAMDPLDSEILFTTASGLTLLWGRSAVRKAFGELSVHEKMQNLRSVLQQYPGLKGICEVDLRYDRPTVALNTQIR